MYIIFAYIYVHVLGSCVPLAFANTSTETNSITKKKSIATAYFLSELFKIMESFIHFSY